MKNKLGLLVLVVFIALASMGMSYADDKFIELFGPVTSWDNEGVDNVGVVIAYPYQGDVVVSVSNAYPGYEAYVTFSIIHISDGTDPIYVDGIVIDNSYAGTEMDVVVTDWNGDPIPVDTVLYPGDILGLVYGMPFLFLRHWLTGLFQEPRNNLFFGPYRSCSFQGLTKSLFGFCLIIFIYYFEIRFHEIFFFFRRFFFLCAGLFFI